MILCIDSETSGLIRDDLPADDPSQPHICQIGAHLFDPEFRPINIFEVLIKPESWTVEPEAYAVHGIEEIQCVRFGIDIRVALAMLQQLAAKARVIVAHHMNFDRKVVAAQLAKVGSDGQWWQRQASKFRCTMELSTDHCRIPGEFGLKFPSLEEAFCHFHPGVEFHTTHRAGEDIRACAAIYKALLAANEALAKLP
jgi:DNA polymerase-3 subunit epsilon